MPGALNLPMKSVLDDKGRLKRGNTLTSAFHDAGVVLDRPIVTTCGSGVTAAVLTLALAELGTDSRLYDGSWAQWGSGTQTPVVTGA
jgi:thiosulfate/3-mercaptopyruvate sulfurtransferase